MKNKGEHAAACAMIFEAGARQERVAARMLTCHFLSGQRVRQLEEEGVRGVFVLVTEESTRYKSKEHTLNAMSRFLSLLVLFLYAAKIYARM